VREHQEDGGTRGSGQRLGLGSGEERIAWSSTEACVHRDLRRMRTS
jgi:hypothetical protein